MLQDLHRITRKYSPQLGGHMLLMAMVLLAGFTSSSAALALRDDPVEVRDFIAETTDLLDWAGDIVHESENLQARRVLGEARRLHERSIRMTDQDRPVAAMPIARRARAATLHAVRLARDSLALSERFLIMDERDTNVRGNLLDRARTAGDRQALDLLARAESQSSRAREQYHQGDAKRAVRMLEQVEMLQNRAAEILGPGRDPEHVDQLLKRTRTFIERGWAAPGIADDPRRQGLLKDAEAALDKAYALLERGRPGQALQTGGIARRLADQARLGPDGSQAPEAARRQIDRWDTRAARIQVQLEEHPDQNIVEQWDSARDHRLRAANLLAQGKPLIALRQIKLAHDLLNAVERRLK